MFPFLKKDFFNFIHKNSNADISKLALTVNRDKLDFPLDFALTQIKCRKSTKKKLSNFNSYEQFIYPDNISSEQASNQIVAKYHADLIGRDKKVIDLTCGLGIDAFTISLNNNRVTAIELDSLKAEAAIHNSGILSLKDFRVVNADCMDYLNKEKDKFDYLFVDPARRDNNNGRTYGFKDCRPDILENLDLLKKKADTILIKASPMLDLYEIKKELGEVSEFHIVSVSGECKEIMIIINSQIQDISENPAIFITNIKNNGENKKLEFKWSDLGKTDIYADISDIQPGTYLYDPYASIHKLNISARLIHDYREMKRISPNTDLYWSKILYEEFPGRCFMISSITDKKELKNLKGIRREIVTRNYPVSNDDLKKKLKINPGSDNDFIYAFKAGKEERLIVTDCKLIFLD